MVARDSHIHELKKSGKRKTKTLNGEINHKHIGIKIEEANISLNNTLPGWTLSRDYCYQISNRFTWAWKIASIGIPVILVYLGFVNAADMRKPFIDDIHWEETVREHCRGIVPDAIWEQRLDIYGTSFRALIRSLPESIQF